MQADKKNMERMEEVVPDSDEQALQHFCSNSPWSEREVLDQIALGADKILGGCENSCLFIDESGFAKKGDKSVGVARQWNGRLGKVDNCQVGVFAALSREDKVTLIDNKLYLPKEWVEDKNRCLTSGIPEARHRHVKKKVNLALEMVEYNRKLGLRFNWVGADGFYGKDPEFTRNLNTMGELFVVDVHKDQKIYLEDPEPFIPLPLQSKVDEEPVKLQAKTEPMRVDKWATLQADTSWILTTLRGSTKGKLKVEVLHTRVFLWDGKEKHAKLWHLIVQRNCRTKSDYNYSLSNAPAETTASRLAFMQSQRFWIERAFKDGKSESGMADYQVRGWNAWHHHMALVSMAMLFMLQERLLLKETHPLLSCSDIETLLAHFLLRRDLTVEEVIRQMDLRHKKRQSSIDSAYRRKVKSEQANAP